MFSREQERESEKRVKGCEDFAFVSKCKGKYPKWNNERDAEPFSTEI